MSTTFPCPSCGAHYTHEQVPPGQEFTCGACEATIVAPEAPAPGGATARPAVRRPQRPSAAGRRREPEPRSRKALVLGLGAVAAVVAIVVVVAATSGNDDPGTTATTTGTATEAPAPSPEARAAAEIERVKAGHDVKTAEGAHAAGQELARIAEGWKADGRAAAAALLLAEARRLDDRALELDPDFGPVRASRGERKYEGDLEALAQAPWISTSDAARANEVHRKLARATEKSEGWAKEAAFADYDALMTELGPKKEAWNKLESSPFFQKARELERGVAQDLAEKFKDVPPEKWRGIEMAIEPPYVFFVQKDPSWTPADIARSRSRSLKALEAIVRHDYGEELGLGEIDGPIPVLMFRSHDMYKQYSGPDSGAYAHFEPWSGRLAVHDDCDYSTIMHEGTHMLMWNWTKVPDASKKLNTQDRSYWFQEGIAEWYSGAHMIRNPDGTVSFEIGRLHPNRMDGIRSLQTRDAIKRLFKIKELVGTKYADRAEIRRTHRELAVYAQAWFLIYFLEHFNVDEEGYVHPDKPGIYRDRWVQYVKAELSGRNGLEEFMKALQLDEEGLERMEIEYWRYFDYVRRKLDYEQVKDKLLIPWHEKKNPQGKVLGEKADDLLDPFNPETAPPR